ncbi:MFS transporter [Xylophilus sp. Leaf220]|uniref:MFS transporter n=1 Tax=Xylophilus sp. Leaf220 TaxID=1735686 RepID=UPI000AA1D436|nr:MFS transporter [Xylophilus sp. Leaf220]
MDEMTNSMPASETGVRHRLRRQSLLFAGLFCAVLFGLSLVLIAWRVEQVLTTLSQDRTDRVVRQLAEEGENAMRLGLATGDLEFLHERLERLRREDGAVRAVFIDARDGAPVAQTGDEGLRRLVDRRWNTQLLGSVTGASSRRTGTQPIEVRNVPGHVLTGSAMVDPAGVPAATVWIVSDPGLLRSQARDAALDIVVKALPLVALTLGVFYLVLYGWGWQTVTLLQRGTGAQADARLPARGILLVLLVALLAAPLGMIWIARESARPFVTNQIEANASAVATTAAGQIDRALRAGVPLQSLAGLDALFRERLAAAPELTWLALRAPDGGELARIGLGEVPDAARPLPERSAPVAGSGARVVAAYPADYVDRALGAMLVDLVLALVISAVLVRELTRGLWRRSLLHPLLDYRLARVWRRIDRLRPRGGASHVAAAESTSLAEAAARCRAALGATGDTVPAGSASDADGAAAFGPQLTRLRLAVFLIALSDELLRPFFTVFASEMQAPGDWLSPAMVAGLPVAAFMATLALAQPAGPVLARRFDLRHALMLGALAGAAALVCTAFTREVGVLVLLRAVSGVAYGLGLILVQTAIVRCTPAGQRARNLAEVAAAIVAAGIVGPPFGGMVAGRVGDAYAMLACALCMGCAFLAVLRLRLPRPAGAGTRATTATAGGWRGYAAVFRNPRAMCVIMGSAVPARLVAVTVLVVVVPLYMREIEQPAATAGRVMLLYFLCFAATASLMAHWSDALGQRKPFIVAGCLLAAAACLLLPTIGGIAGMAACCALLGVGQATQSSPQIALVTEVFEESATGPGSATPEQALAAFRLIERIGSIAAPFATALAIALLGLSGAVAAVGVLLAVAAAGVWLGLRAGPAAPALRTR